MIRFKEQTWFTGVPIVGAQSLAYNIDKPYSEDTYNYSDPSVSVIFPVQTFHHGKTKGVVFMLPVINEWAFYNRTSFLYPANELHRARLFQVYRARFSRRRIRKDKECQQ